ncbi:MAG: hypothetical protein PVS2B2_27000 [Candidatus Acidiferrum sp.]
MPGAIWKGTGKYRFAITDYGAAEEGLAERAVRAFQSEVRGHYHYDNGDDEHGLIAQAKH